MNNNDDTQLAYGQGMAFSFSGVEFTVSTASEYWRRASQPGNLIQVRDTPPV